MFNLANILTGSNLICGVLSILMAFSGRLELAVLFIFIGALFDFLDGFVARALKQQGELGKQLDSLADIVTFGVAPGIIVFVLLILSGSLDIIMENGGKPESLWQRGTMGSSINYWINVFLNDLVNNESKLYIKHFYGWYLALPFVSFMIPFFSLFRLAKFNIDTRQTENFIGLPTPANAIFFSSFALILWDGFGTNDWRFTWSILLIKDQIMMIFIVLFSFLLISEVPMFSMKFKNVGWSGNEKRIIFIIGALILLFFLQVWAIPIIFLSYVLVGIVGVLVRK